MVEEGSIGIFFYFSIKGDVDMIVSKTEKELVISATTTDNKSVTISFLKHYDLLFGYIQIPHMFLRMKAHFEKGYLSAFAVDEPKFNARVINQAQTADLGEQAVYRSNFYYAGNQPVVEFISSYGRVDIPITDEDANAITAFLHEYAK
ncbi:hypothetical protein_gp234 [Bacillus phage vB_BceM_WH1]|nr:hypothetical protein_gp234 [Bacillus phage vB_BceM_WH1]